MPSFELNPMHDRKMHIVAQTSKGVSGDIGTHGQLFRLDDSSDKWFLADATSEATTLGLLGLLIGRASVDNPAEFLTQGEFKTSGLNKGSTYHVSTTPGSISPSQPSLEDEVLRVIGWAKEANKLIFSPSEDYFTITEVTQPISTVTTSTVLDETYETVLVDASAGAVTITLPAAVGNKGKIFNIKKIDSSSNFVTVDADSAETIDELLTQVVTGQYDCMDIQSDNTGWWII